MADERANTYADALVAYNLQRLRRDAGLTQDQLAARVGISKTTISNYENASQGMSDATMRKLSKILERDWQEFFTPIHDTAAAQRMLDKARARRRQQRRPPGTDPR